MLKLQLKLVYIYRCSGVMGKYAAGELKPPTIGEFPSLHLWLLEWGCLITLTLSTCLILQLLEDLVNILNICLRRQDGRLLMELVSY